ncbi:hypothetical protein COY65_01580 [Candidatus Jorgensenbacteria bacterium CG_4_10_14_0_8_um_filter_39_13]|uniref:Uncharacterized protein n=2 Tax=Candidatus Joergenseniibacteriota TaxID=1752739 RepID=A0A2M7RHB8_9BACT|nr:MAG: hypothetical protein COV54_00150 [Candidatus Jorgensenbacteria bacterium CG11_big_fil_rev_8_21_14_0_20_38_23]PIV13371.1 MAG: hypothetical protein COS46_00620 [Candidatus Jorgensenbacteria bacterium CG03_land_8_20_14_0_80_38_39]PIW97470.1 MAG: hypothetical protein COZ81_02365 [Candidatus Jorgensenbacteria bacterium CG_4_8_14_3_um_filter_38_10]PIY96123.1 MAG: hypothetical protein COY65_01580 [Candidatus Jorgensenbacteria bacterium CG_4_10_14_0_8_um_filter_39_13]PJA95120.1 MAG: hypothetica
MKIRFTIKNMDNRTFLQMTKIKIEEEYQKFLGKLKQLEEKQNRLIDEYQKKLKQRKNSLHDKTLIDQNEFGKL